MDGNCDNKQQSKLFLPRVSTLQQLPTLLHAAKPIDSQSCGSCTKCAWKEQKGEKNTATTLLLSCEERAKVPALGSACSRNTNGNDSSSTWRLKKTNDRKTHREKSVKQNVTLHKTRCRAMQQRRTRNIIHKLCGIVVCAAVR